MTAKQQLIITTWDTYKGEKSYKKIAEMLNLKTKDINDVIRNREEFAHSQWTPKKRKIPCLRCNTLFHSEGKYNRICEMCRGYINKHHHLEETYSIGRIE